MQFRGRGEGKIIHQNATQVKLGLPILSVMINIALNAVRHIITGIFRKFTPQTKTMGRFSECRKKNQFAFKGLTGHIAP